MSESQSLTCKLREISADLDVLVRRVSTALAVDNRVAMGRDDLQEQHAACTCLHALLRARQEIIELKV